jgi:excisionase family DNA binding protein
VAAGVFLTVRQVAERLQVSTAVVYQLCAGRKLVHHRVGSGRGTIRIAEEDLAAFVEGCKVEPHPPANAGALKHIRTPSDGSP